MSNGIGMWLSCYLPAFASGAALGAAAVALLAKWVIKRMYSGRADRHV